MRTLTAVALVGLATLAGAPTAGASGWQLQALPAVAAAPNGKLADVSCSSSVSCVAVGSFTARDGLQAALGEHWDGASWTIDNVPTPAGASNTDLTAVSCPSADSCTAVGSFTDANDRQKTLMERFDGASWQLVAVPNPPDSTGSAFSAVSCTGPAACTAVGYSLDAFSRSVTLAARWDGTGWSIQTTVSR